MKLASKQLVGALPKEYEGGISIIEGKLAVVAVVDGKQQLQWGDWRSGLHNKVNSPDAVSDGRLLFTVQEGDEDKEEDRYRVIWGDEVGKAYHGVEGPTIVDGKPMYASYAVNHSFLVHGDTEEALFYHAIFDFKVVDGKPLYRALINSSRGYPGPPDNQCVVWGNQQGALYDYVGYLDVCEGELVYEARRGDEAMAVRGKVEGPKYFGCLGPVFVSHGKLIYQTGGRGKKCVVWDGREGRHYGDIWMLTVADGKPLYSAGTGNTQSPTDNMRVVWGEQEFKAYACVQEPRILEGKPLFYADVRETGQHDYRVVWGDKIFTRRKGWHQSGLLLGQLVCYGNDMISWGEWESPRCDQLIEIGFGETVAPGRWERRYVEILSDNTVRYYALHGHEVYEMIFAP